MATSSFSATRSISTQTFVKRVIGVPGDHIKIVNQQIYRNGVKLNEPYVYHKNPYPDTYRDNFPGSEPNVTSIRAGQGHAAKSRNQR